MYFFIVISRSDKATLVNRKNMEFEFVNLNKHCHPAAEPSSNLSVLYPATEPSQTPEIIVTQLNPELRFLSFRTGLKNPLKCLNHLSLVCKVISGHRNREYTFEAEQLRTVFLPIPSNCQTVRIRVEADDDSSMNFCGVHIGHFQQTSTTNEFNYESYIPVKRQLDGGFLLDKINTSQEETSPEKLPIPSPRYMAFGESGEKHLNTGRKAFESMQNALEKAGIDISSFSKTLEFGCSNARILRWFAPYKNMMKWGVDIEADKIKWCLENLAPSFHFATNTQIPHLSFPDGYFDFIYAGSVFTHITELHNQWIIELARISRPGGCLYLTFLDESAVKVLLESDTRKAAKELKNDLNFDRIKDGNYSFASNPPKSKAMLSNVYMTREYIKYITEPFLELVAIEEKAYAQMQTAYIFRRK